MVMHINRIMASEIDALMYRGRSGGKKPAVTFALYDAKATCERVPFHRVERIGGAALGGNLRVMYNLGQLPPAHQGVSASYS